MDQSAIDRQNASTTRTRFGQTFAPAVRGALTAIEIASYRCVREGTGKLRMTVYEGLGVDGRRLGVAEASAPFDGDCAQVFFPLLHPSERGATTFDFTAGCIALEEDRDYSFIVEPVAAGDAFATGITVPSGIGSQFDGYARGQIIVEEDGIFYLQATRVGIDVAFKVFVER